MLSCICTPCSKALRSAVKVVYWSIFQKIYGTCSGEVDAAEVVWKNSVATVWSFHSCCDNWWPLESILNSEFKLTPVFLEQCATPAIKNFVNFKMLKLVNIHKLLRFVVTLCFFMQLIYCVIFGLKDLVPLGPVPLLNLPPTLAS